ncbi:MAG TPA: ribonuclease III [Alphaproteobacteria bacterium]|nr:ribonuclease III [Alphaproteobacteria bacterium]HAJ47434.1 ribonuclease III [Alphaproteobacteria bacterium]
MRSAKNLGERLAPSLGYQFQDASLLVQALRHASAGGANNERLEFLGDRILGLIVADMILAAHPEETEGGLAPRFNALVRLETCAQVAIEAGLDQLIEMSPSEERSGGRAKPAILGDACEAVIGALFRDGGLEAARTFVERYWRDKLASVSGDMRDPKSTLQEWAQGRALGTPVYRLLGKTGPDHAPMFSVEAFISDARRATGEGNSRRVAEQDAARRLYARIKDEA